MRVLDPKAKGNSQALAVRAVHDRRTNSDSNKVKSKREYELGKKEHSMIVLFDFRNVEACLPYYLAAQSHFLSAHRTFFSLTKIFARQSIFGACPYLTVRAEILWRARGG